MKIKPEVQAIIDRCAAIDWRTPPHDTARAERAYRRRLQRVGLTRHVRWIADPADFDAWAARAAWDARAARDAWAARAARAAWDAWDAWDAGDAGDWAAWDARDAVGFLNLSIAPVPDWLRQLIDTYEPMIDAFESGVFAHILLEHEIVILVAPATWIDDQRRLHRAQGPALAWRRTKVCAWHGTVIPNEWIEQPRSLSPQVALSHGNVEQRRAACEILGWHHILSALNARRINKHRSPEVGELVEVDLPDSGRSRFLRVRCGTGREFALPVPREVNTAIEAQAWTWGLDVKEFRKPEVRT